MICYMSQDVQDKKLDPPSNILVSYDWDGEKMIRMDGSDDGTDRMMADIPNSISFAAGGVVDWTYPPIARSQGLLSECRTEYHYSERSSQAPWNHQQQQYQSAASSTANLNGEVLPQSELPKSLDASWPLTGPPPPVQHSLQQQQCHNEPVKLNALQQTNNVHQGEENDVRWVRGTWTNKLDESNNDEDDDSWIDTIFNAIDDTIGKDTTTPMTAQSQDGQLALDHQEHSNTPLNKLSLVASIPSPSSLVDLKHQGRRHTTTKRKIPRQFPFKPYVGMIGMLDDKELLSELEANTRPM